ncbi:MAG: Mur ligase family protein [Clostridiales bacterium]|jgi:UDP-N-acetylmuramyl tripeptide synthase|nr:Mur ligase family protein [Eubacteriales bacterium]MDH7566607.1 Mur ligase family protein [Clostridiales bacterium]
MLIAGIVGRNEKNRTANLINSIFAKSGKKVSIIDSKNLTGLDSRLVKTYISELEKNKVEILILKINLDDINNEVYSYIHFDTLIYNDKSEDAGEINIENYTTLMRRIFSSLDEKGTAIINVDCSDLIQFLQGLNRHVVTYGFNPKASITASSTGDDLLKNYMCCLQRTISARNGLLIEPQEYSVTVESGDMDAYNVLAASSFAILNGVNLNEIFSAGLKP